MVIVRIDRSSDECPRKTPNQIPPKTHLTTHTRQRTRRPPAVPQPQTNPPQKTTSHPPFPSTNQLTITTSTKNSARDALRQCLPDALRSDVTFAQSLKDDVTINRWLANLLYNLNEA